MNSGTSHRFFLLNNNLIPSGGDRYAANLRQCVHLVSIGVTSPLIIVQFPPSGQIPPILKYKFTPPMTPNFPVCKVHLKHIIKLCVHVQKALTLSSPTLSDHP